MAMSSGGRTGQAQSDINMTPMIDVMLVLLIIFMVVQQAMQRGLSVQVPPVAPATPVDGPEQIVLSVDPGPRYFLNQEPVQQANLEARLREVFAARPRKVIFVRGAENLTYGEVIRAVDATRAAGVEVVGVVPRTAMR